MWGPYAGCLSAVWVPVPVLDPAPPSLTLESREGRFREAPPRKDNYLTHMMNVD